MRRRWTERMQDVADVVLALGVTVVTQIEAWTAPAYPEGSGPDVVGPRPVVAAFYLAAALALVVRRRHPFAVAVAVTTALGVPFLLFGASEGFGILLPMLVVLYSTGANTERRTAVWSLALIAALLLVHAVRDPWIVGIDDVVGATPFYLVGVISWLAGVYLRTRRLYVAELRDRAERAEREREEQTRAAVAAERTRIARELHDAVAHAMSVMVVQAEAAEEMLGRDPPRARAPLARIQSVGREGLAEMRRLLGILRQDEEATLAPQPGMDQLDRLVARVRAAGLPVELVVEGEPVTLPTGVGISVFRIVQEGPHERAPTRTGLAGDRTGSVRRVSRARDCRRRHRRRKRLQGEPRRGRDARAHRLLRRHVLGRPGSGRWLCRTRIAPPRGAAMIEVLVADDQELVRDGFTLILDAQEDIEVVGTAEDGAAAVDQVRALRPDVVLMDVRMPVLDGIEATRRLRAAGFDRLAVLMLTTFDLDEYVFEALRVGANGFLLKDVPRSKLIEAVHTVAEGDSLLAPQVLRRLIERFVEGPPPSAGQPAEMDDLTGRERDVLLRLVRGHSNAEIAGDLFLSEATVKTHVAHVLQKLGLRDRVQAVMWAYESGLVRPGQT